MTPADQLVCQMLLLSLYDQRESPMMTVWMAYQVAWCAILRELACMSQSSSASLSSSSSSSTTAAPETSCRNLSVNCMLGDGAPCPHQASATTTTAAERHDQVRSKYRQKFHVLAAEPALDSTCCRTPHKWWNMCCHRDSHDKHLDVVKMSARLAVTLARVSLCWLLRTRAAPGVQGVT